MDQRSKEVMERARFMIENDIPSGYPGDSMLAETRRHPPPMARRLSPWTAVGLTVFAGSVVHLLMLMI